LHGKSIVHCPSGFRGSFILLSVRLQGGFVLSLLYKARARLARLQWSIFILSLLYKARTGPAGSLPCPARPCWPPSQPVSPSPIFAGPGPVVRPWWTRAPSRTDVVNLWSPPTFGHYEIGKFWCFKKKEYLTKYIFLEKKNCTPKKKTLVQIKHARGI